MNRAVLPDETEKMGPMPARKPEIRPGADLMSGQDPLKCASPGGDTGPADGHQGHQFHRIIVFGQVDQPIKPGRPQARVVAMQTQAGLNER